MIPYTQTFEEIRRVDDYDCGYHLGKQNVPVTTPGSTAFQLGYCEGLWDRRCHEVMNDDGN